MSFHSFKKKFLFVVCLLVIGIFLIARLYYYLTDDFRLGNITQSVAYDPFWEIPALETKQQQEVLHILNQPFVYLDKGAQSYVFKSADDKYVLKFFKFKHLRPSLWINCVPSWGSFLELKNNYLTRKKRKLDGIFDGYVIAYKENNIASGLVYMHLFPTTHLKTHLTLIDKLGLERKINLDEYAFLLQKKGETLRMRLQEYLNNQNLEQAKQALRAVIAMYIAEYQQGLFDRDHGVMRNTGFIGEQPFHLDLGKFSKEKSMRDVDVYKKDLQHVFWIIQQWVQQFYPQYYENLVSFLYVLYAQYIGEECEPFEKMEAKDFKKRYYTGRLGFN